ncbi:hypothetical protein Taro_030799 [Colocasia esculenta]|uniref:Uncharacterized protein n=1 Tax=Colocasia esculenta TaxID=4460 RepID=A0A843W199_COLES|nr:hypothetical protein [Colocasia esculenta]
MSKVPTKYPQISSRRQPLWHNKVQRKARIKDGTSSKETVSICQNNSLQVLPKPASCRSAGQPCHKCSEHGSPGSRTAFRAT